MEAEVDETEVSIDKSPTVLPDLPNPEACVICLDRITDKAIALPCKHDNFDFSCLGTWLEKSRSCPLCKAEVKWIKYDLSNPISGTLYTCPVLEQNPGRVREAGRDRWTHESRGRLNNHEGSRHHLRVNQRYVRRQDAFINIEGPGNGRSNSSLDFRRRVYRNHLYSLHVGANKISRHRNFTAATFANDAQLISRTKTWVRRELQVFSFLNPASADYGTAERRASNAEFLLEYVVALLKSIDIRGSGGQAEALLSEFLGRENARVFLHELDAWLRSPYEKLEDWDRVVQYLENGASLREVDVDQKGRHRSVDAASEHRKQRHKPP